MEKTKVVWHSIDTSRALKALGSSARGLSADEAASRLKQNKKNLLTIKPRTSKYKIFADQFKSPLIYILIFAAAVSLFFENPIDAGIIIAAVVFNAVVGFFQENKAETALEKLKNFIQPVALVRRDNEIKQIPAEELVVGDIVLIAAGDKMPADCRLLEAQELEADEALLTGESISAQKQTEANSVGASLGDRSAMIFSGTTIIKGRGTAVVVATGDKTELGKIASAVGEVIEEETPLQSKLSKLSRQFGIAVAAICLFIFAIGMLQGRQTVELFVTAVAVAVAAIPEGLPVAVTVILTIGMQRLLKRKSLVRKLIAAETLGSTTVICTDKTGTLTAGHMELENIITSDHEINLIKHSLSPDNPELLQNILRVALLCNDSILSGNEGKTDEKIVGTPTDRILFKTALQFGLDHEKEQSFFPRLGELPFTSAAKFMATIHAVTKKTRFFKSKNVIFVKGAAEMMLEKSTSICHGKDEFVISATQKDKLRQEISKLANEGLRVIAFAYRNVSRADCDINSSVSDLTLLGFATLKDPLRPEARQTIELCCLAGIRPIIITGDHPLTARSIAREVGLKVGKDNVVSGEELEKMDDQKLRRVVRRASVFARVSPHHKLRIIRSLKDDGEVVAMIGDGINDAPAIKAADIGVALGSGTDVAKEASDIVLLDNNFATIVAAVEQGRIIFSNTRKVTAFLTSDIFSEIILIVGSIALDLPLALLPAQILWLNIINDSFPNFSLAFEQGSSKIMADKPTKLNEPILSRRIGAIVFGACAIRDLLIFAWFVWIWQAGADLAYLRTMIFAILGAKSLISIFSLRSFHRHAWQMNPFSNPYLIFAIMISASFMLAAIYWPPLQMVLGTVALDLNSWMPALAFSILSITLIEFVKYLFIKTKKTEEVLLKDLAIEQHS